MCTPYEADSERTGLQKEVGLKKERWKLLKNLNQGTCAPVYPNTYLQPGMMTGAGGEERDNKGERKTSTHDFTYNIHGQETTETTA